MDPHHQPLQPLGPQAVPPAFHHHRHQHRHHAPVATAPVRTPPERRGRHTVEISDLRMERRTEADARKLLTSIVVRLQKAPDRYEVDDVGCPVPPSWQRASLVEELDVSPHDAARKVHELKKSGPLALDKKKTLGLNVQSQLDRAQAMLEAHEPDPRFCYELAQLDWQTKPIACGSPLLRPGGECRCGTGKCGRPRPGRECRCGTGQCGKPLPGKRRSRGKLERVSVTAYFWRTPRRRENVLGMLDEWEGAKKRPPATPAASLATPTTAPTTPATIPAAAPPLGRPPFPQFPPPFPPPAHPAAHPPPAGLPAGPAPPVGHVPGQPMPLPNYVAPQPPLPPPTQAPRLPPPQSPRPQHQPHCCRPPNHPPVHFATGGQSAPPPSSSGSQARSARGNIDVRSGNIKVYIESPRGSRSSRSSRGSSDSARSDYGTTGSSTESGSRHGRSRSRHRDRPEYYGRCHSRRDRDWYASAGSSPASPRPIMPPPVDLDRELLHAYREGRDDEARALRPRVIHDPPSRRLTVSEARRDVYEEKLNWIEDRLNRTHLYDEDRAEARSWRDRHARLRGDLDDVVHGTIDRLRYRGSPRLTEPDNPFGPVRQAQYYFSRCR